MADVVHGTSPGVGQASITDLAMAPTELPAAKLSEPNKTFEPVARLAGKPGDVVHSSGVPRGAIYSLAGDGSTGPTPNKWLFHYNPSSLAFNTSWDTTKPTFTGADAEGASQTFGNIPQTGAAESMHVDVLLNRLWETNLSYKGPLATLFHTFGTLVDVQALYRTLNGLSLQNVLDIVHAGDAVNMPPSDLGFLYASRCKLLFGVGDFTWYGFCSNVTVQHDMFVNSMAPVLTSIGLDFTRSLSPDQLSGQSDPNTSANPGAAGPAPTTSTKNTADKTTGNIPAGPPKRLPP